MIMEAEICNLLLAGGRAWRASDAVAIPLPRPENQEHQRCMSWAGEDGCGSSSQAERERQNSTFFGLFAPFRPSVDSMISTHTREASLPHSLRPLNQMLISARNPLTDMPE